MRIKGFSKDLKCYGGFQFEIGKEYKIETDQPLKLCSNTVFHYCDSLQKVNEHFSCDDEIGNRFCEIEVLGEEITDGDKFGSNHIKVLREITGEELKILKGQINGNTGLFNTGDWNTGDWNTGYMNTGDRNTGNRNTGNMNTGHMNTGHMNTGDRNTGDMNTGYMNTGYMNTGNRNTGYMNTGNRNTGYMNTGDMNTGDRNTGNRNTGNRNTGYMNTGDWNTGLFNSCDNSNGVFCNAEDKNIRIFNVPSGMSLTDFYNSNYYTAICSSEFKLTEWVNYTEEEMKTDKEKEMIGGYLKRYTFKEACANWWANMTEDNKNIIKSIPNFNAEVFEDITGIKV